MNKFYPQTYPETYSNNFLSKISFKPVIHKMV